MCEFWRKGNYYFSIFRSGKGCITMVLLNFVSANNRKPKISYAVESTYKILRLDARRASGSASGVGVDLRHSYNGLWPSSLGLPCNRGVGCNSGLDKEVAPIIAYGVGFIGRSAGYVFRLADKHCYRYLRHIHRQRNRSARLWQHTAVRGKNLRRGESSCERCRLSLLYRER